MNVLVLFEAGRGGKGFAAVWAGVGSCSNVLGADVPLQVAGVGEHLQEKTPSVCGTERGGAEREAAGGCAEPGCRVRDGPQAQPQPQAQAQP